MGRSLAHAFSNFFVQATATRTAAAGGGESRLCRLADLLSKMQPRVEAATRQRDLLGERAVEAEARAAALEAEMRGLEAKVADMDRLHNRLAEVTQARQNLQQQVADLSRRFQASDTANTTLKAELGGADEALRALREKVVAGMQEEYVVGESPADLPARPEQQPADKALTAPGGRLESEKETAEIEDEGDTVEPEAVTKAMRDIHSKATHIMLQTDQDISSEKSRVYSRGEDAVPPSASHRKDSPPERP